MSVISFLSKTGVHEQALRKFFKGSVAYDGPPVFDHPLYCIGFFNRSGSNLLAGYLRATPYFSGFHEQLNFNTVEKQSADWGVTNFPGFIREASERFGKGQFVHGFKASVDQLMMLQRFGIPKMFMGGMRIIHITRGDLVGQAVSYQIASQTQQWTSQQTGLGSDVEVRFDAKQVDSLIEATQASVNGIAMLAEIFDCPRHHVSYEELVKRPGRVLRRIAQFAGQTGDDWPLVKPGIERQASDLNEQFRQQYLARTRNRLL